MHCKSSRASASPSREDKKTWRPEQIVQLLDACERAGFMPQSGSIAYQALEFMTENGMELRALPGYVSVIGVEIYKASAIAGLGLVQVPRRRATRCRKLAHGSRRLSAAATACFGAVPAEPAAIVPRACVCGMAEGSIRFSRGVKRFAYGSWKNDRAGKNCVSVQASPGTRPRCSGCAKFRITPPGPPNAFA